jgi:NAD-dependent dihydropyrimidine dehydrogenase PreA subunit
VAYVIVDTCTKDGHCVEVCPVDCIHPKEGEPDFETAPQLYVNPDECIACGACVPVCPSNSVYAVEDLPAELSHFVQINASYYAH